MFLTHTPNTVENHLDRHTRRQIDTHTQADTDRHTQTDRYTFKETDTDRQTRQVHTHKDTQTDILLMDSGRVTGTKSFFHTPCSVGILTLCNIWREGNVGTAVWTLLACTHQHIKHDTSTYYHMTHQRITIRTTIHPPPTTLPLDTPLDTLTDCHTHTHTLPHHTTHYHMTHQHTASLHTH
jgi:hypothetical protein